MFRQARAPDPTGASVPADRGSAPGSSPLPPAALQVRGLAHCLHQLMESTKRVVLEKAERRTNAEQDTELDPKRVSAYSIRMISPVYGSITTLSEPFTSVP